MAKETKTGLVIRQDCIEWATVRRVRGGFETVSSGSVEIVKPAGGDDQAAAVEEARTATAERLQKALGKAPGEVVLGLSPEHVLVRVVELPTVEAGELPGMVELQVDKFAPFPLESLVISHEIIEQRESQSVVLVAAVKETVVQEQGALLGAAGIKIVRVDALAAARRYALESAGVVASEGRHTFLILDGPVPEVMVFEEGLPVLLSSLGELQDVDAENMAEELGRETGYLLMSLELERGTAASRRLSVLSDSDLPRGLDAILERECGVTPQAGSMEDLPSPAVALAQRHDSAQAALNLTPDAWHAEETSRLFRKRVITIGAVAAGIWILGAVALFGSLAFQKSRLASLRAEADRWGGPAMEVRDLRRRVFMIERYTNRRYSALECLRIITEQMPPSGMDLTEFAYRQGELVEISGEANAVSLVYEFKNRLDASGFFGETTLRGPRTDRNRKELFDIEMALPGGESS